MKIYLAIPYTGNENSSFIKANRIAAKLMNEGHIVFSPISHSHSIDSQCDLDKKWEFWKKQDESFIEWCDELYVVMLNGWKESVGVNAEMEIAKRLGKPIKYIEYKTEPINGKTNIQT